MASGDAVAQIVMEYVPRGGDGDQQIVMEYVPRGERGPDWAGTGFQVNRRLEPEREREAAG